MWLSNKYFAVDSFTTKIANYLNKKISDGNKKTCVCNIWKIGKENSVVPSSMVAQSRNLTPLATNPTSRRPVIDRFGDTPILTIPSSPQGPHSCQRDRTMFVM